VKPTPLTSQPPLIEPHATGSSDGRNAKTFDKRWICREPLINLKSYGLRDALTTQALDFVAEFNLWLSEIATHASVGK
jgi:hypothetical protein